MNLSEIEDWYRSGLKKRFPYDDLRKVRSALTSQERRIVEGLNPDLDSYLSFIAGFASSATRIKTRPMDQLKRALPFLDKSFFETFPDYEFLKDRITESETPQLYSRLKVAEILRIQLARHIREILRSDS